MPPLQLSASSSASSGPSASGGIGAGASYNIGGINFGYQPQTATSAGGLPSSAVGASGIASGLGGTPSSSIVLIVGAIALAGLAFFILRRK